MRPAKRRAAVKRAIDRLETLEPATGTGDRQPQKGIAHRLDAIEDTQEEILTRLDKLEE